MAVHAEHHHHHHHHHPHEAGPAKACCRMTPPAVPQTEEAPAPAAAPASPAKPADSLNRTALLATLHCLSGCAIGEVLGLVIGTALGWGNLETIALAVTLAFLFGFGLTMLPLLKSGMAFGTALGLAFASDFFSITVMEVVDNAAMLLIPGAMDAGLADPLFWISMAGALALAALAAFPVNRWLIARGKGHAVIHAHHGPHGHHGH